MHLAIMTDARAERLKAVRWKIALFCLLALGLAAWLIFRHSFSQPAPVTGDAITGEAQLNVPVNGTPDTRSRINTSSGTPLRTLASEGFRARFNPRTDQREVSVVLRTLEVARRDFTHRVAASSVNFIAPASMDVLIHDTTGDFVAATGQPWWAGAVTHENVIELQPLEILRSRGTLQTTLRHEYAHAVIEAVGRGRTPRWLAEGMATYIAGEGALFSNVQSKTRLTVDEIERRLAQPQSAEEMRILYAASYREVLELIRKEGEAGVWRRVAQY